MTRYAVVVPTVGRPGLGVLLESLAMQGDPRPVEVVVVDDRRPGCSDDVLDPRGQRAAATLPLRVVRGFGHGPGAARNLGWRVTTAPWVCFLDDDVVLPDGWSGLLATDLSAAPPGVAGVQGGIVVPLPRNRRPTDWERSTAGLQDASWATADLAYRRAALESVHGFDERFPRAYREDADLALRVVQAGWELRRGTRTVTHPVRSEAASISVRVQRGNADDALMRRLHGRRWRERAGTGRGRFPWHVAAVAAQATAVGAGLVGPRHSGRARAAAGVASAVALALWADFVARRVVPGPRTRREVGAMAWSSAAIPAAAVWHRAVGAWRHRHATSWPPPPRAVLFDRDGTLVTDIPYNGDPSLVDPVPSARYAVSALRHRGIRLGVVSNQSGIGRGLVRPEDVTAVNRQVDRVLGPFDAWAVCPHEPEAGCGCRKPAPGLVLEAARRLGVHPRECVVIGDIGSDVVAARAAGAAAILVPTEATRPDEVRDAPVVATDLRTAVDLILDGGTSDA